MSVLLLTMGPQLGITADLPVVAVGGAGVIRFRPIGAAGPVKWALVDSTLPAEWDSALNPDGDAVTLTTSDAETPGTFSVTVRAVDNARIPVVRSFDVRVMALPLTISGSFPSWTVGTPAIGTLSISGGVPPYSGLSVISGAIPEGVSISLIGNQISASGTPTASGPWEATLQVSDSASTPANASLSGNVGDACDPYFDDVVSLLHFDGPNGSTTFTDETGRAWSSGGGTNVNIQDGELSLGGTNGDYIWTPDSPDLALGSNDFCIEMFVTMDTIGANTVLVHKRQFNGYSPFVIALLGPRLYSTVSTTGSSWAFTILDTVDFPIGVKTHVRFNRSGNTFRLFKNGVIVGTATSSGSLLVTPDRMEIGRWAYENSRYLHGKVGEFRMTNGSSRETSAFIPEARNPDIACP